jgi:putative ABC transport system permease protein
METLLQDLRYGMRMLRARPIFTVVAIFTLALGIGANTAIFTVVNAVLLRPLPYPQPERLMQIGTNYSGDEVLSASEPKFLFWQERSQSFEAMALYQLIGSGVNLSGGDEPEYVSGLKASADFFRAVGVGPILGRAFTKEEDQRGGERVAILSDSLWRERFGADPDSIGRVISLDGQAHTVIGVMPHGFHFIPSADVIVPLRPSQAGDQDDNYEVIGRLKPGLTREQARADMKLVAEAFQAEHAGRTSQQESVNVRQFQDNLTASSRPLLLILLGAVSFVLLIACANVANLQLTRAAARQKEIAVRLALGAGLRRITLQLLTEGVLISLAGGAAGLLLAVWGVDYLTALIPEGLIPQVGEVNIDLRVLGFTLATAILTGIVFGLAPMIQAARVDVNSSLKEGSGKGVTAAGRGRLRSALVVAEMALALVLLIGAGLLIRTFANLLKVEPGFDSRNVLTFQVSMNGSKYDTTAKAAEFYKRALESIESLPEVEAAAVTSNLPLSVPLSLPLKVEGQPDNKTVVQYRMITPEYFRVMRIALREGRAFDERDTEGSEGVAIVNEAFVRAYLPDADPAVQRLTIGRGPFGDPKPRQIVGIVGDTKQSGLGTAAPATVFVPVSQVRNELMLYLRKFRAMKFVARTASDPLKLSAAVKQVMLGLDATLPVADIVSMEQVLARSVAPERFNMSLLGLFAGLGLILAAVGIYGVMSYSVTQRTHEIGIRMALGAKQSDVLKLVIVKGMMLAAIGVVIGLVASYFLTRLMTSLLYGVSATDPVTFVIISLILIGVALGASFVPARRATKVDPMIALRYE